MTKTIHVEWIHLGEGGCGGYNFGETHKQFTDTAGSNWNYLKVRMPMQRELAGHANEFPTVSIAINGVAVPNPVTIWNAENCWLNLQTYEFGIASLPGYNAFGINTLSIYTTGYAGGPEAELIFTTEPHTFAFTLPPAATDKLLIHKSGTTDDYPSLSQIPTLPTELPRYRFRGAVSSSTGASVESDVWLRVIDPADSAPYIPPELRAANDNKDPAPKGVLMAAGCADPTCRAAPGDPLMVHAAPGGRVEFDLEATGQFAGDNYQIEASFDPDFTCATAGANHADLCAHSGIVTAWKRVYIEKRRMLRNGLFLAQNANAGDTFLITRGSHWQGNRGKHDEVSKNENIVIVHAPQINRSDLNAGWYSETHTVLSVQDLGTGQFRVNLGRKQGNTIIPESLQHDYRIDGTDQNIGDAISNLNSISITANDVFDAPMDLVTGEAFRDSFTENVVLPDNTTPGANVPVPFLETGDQPTLQSLAEKWSSVFINGTLQPNRQLLIIGWDNEPGDGIGNAAGLTISELPGRTSSYVFCNAIDHQLNGNNASDVSMWAKKTAAHEIAHQWRTNGSWNLLDHCPTTTKVWNDPTIYCLLAAYADPGAASLSQTMNGIARFHFLTLPGGGTHSEYLEIRKRPDPFVP
jgi:hypothetical protein